jgi:PKD repeat protein
MRIILLFTICFFVLMNTLSQNDIVPSTIDSLTIWLRSDSVELDASETRVTQLYDLSGHENHANQSTSDKQPLYNASEAAIAGYPTVIFDGLNDFMNGTGSVGGITSYTLLCVVRINSRKSYNWIYRNTPVGNNFSFGLSGQGDGKFRYWPQGTSNSVVFDPVVQNNEYHYYSVLTSNDSSVVTRYFFDGIQTGTTNNLVNTHALNGYTVGALGDAVQTLNGEIVELILYNKYLTNQKQYEVENYFRYRYFPSEYISYIDIDNINIDYGFCDTTISIPNIYTNYLWSNGSTTHEATFNTVGTHWVEATNVFGYVDRDTFEITYPNIAQPNSTLFCPGSSVTWNTNLGEHYTYDWSTGETTESINIDTPGSYFVTVTDTNGCSKTFPSIEFEEDAYSTTVSLGPDVSLCSGNAISLVSGEAETVSYTWNTSETTPSIVVNSTGTYSVTTTNANGCEANDDIAVTIIGDAPVVQIGMDANYCQGEAFTYTDNSFTTDGSNITSWSWDFGDLGTSATETGTYAYSDHGPVTVNLTISTDAGCDNSGQLAVDVYQKPIIDYSVVNACQLDEIQFNATQSTLTLIGDWSWDFGDPASGAENTATGENTTHIFDTHGDFTVTLYAEDVLGCRDTTEQLVTILPTPQVDFTFTEVCQGQTVNFVNNSTIASPALIATTQWQLGAGATSTQFSPSRLYTVAGTFDITLTVTANNGCVQAQTQPMKVHALPEPDYTYTASCAGLPTVFTDNSTVPDGEVAFVTWQFNANNPVNANPVSHTFTNPGEQQIRQTVISAFGCQFTAISNIVTNPALSADFSTDPDLLLAGLPITFTNESIGADNVLWEIDAFYTGSDENPALTFDETYIDDTLTIVLIAYNDFGCSDTLVEEMRVYEAITDLAVTNIYTYVDPSGYETIGAELSNLGSSTITRADVFLRLADQLPMKGVYEGELRPGEKEVYVFETTIFPSTNLDTEEDQYICVNAQIVLPAGLVDERPENNERCLARTEDVPVLLTPYPNPASDVVNIKVILPAEEVLDIYVYDATGKVVTRLANQSTLPQGATTYQLDVRQLAVGTYTVYLVRGDGDKKAVRFVVR